MWYIDTWDSWDKTIPDEGPLSRPSIKSVFNLKTPRYQRIAVNLSRRPSIYVSFRFPYRDANDGYLWS